MKQMRKKEAPSMGMLFFNMRVRRVNLIEDSLNEVGLSFIRCILYFMIGFRYIANANIRDHKMSRKYQHSLAVNKFW